MAKHQSLVNEKFFIALGQTISQKRTQLGLTQEELAALSGVNRAFISNMENGIRNPSLGTVASIAKGLRMRLSTLIAKSEENL